jgi:hypothetical protein
LATTVNVCATPAVVAGKPVTANVTAAPGETEIDPVPVNAALAASVTVSDCVLSVLKVTLKVCTPASAGMTVVMPLATVTVGEFVKA